MNKPNSTPVRKLMAQNMLIVDEFDDGITRILFQHLDPGTRRMVPDYTCEVVQDKLTPMTPEELMMVAAAERVAQRLGYTEGLNW